MNFLYIIIFSVIPPKALLGRREGAVTLLAAALFFICVSISLWIEYYMNIILLNLYSTLTIYFTFFIAFRWYFLNPRIYRKNLKKYEASKKWVLKLLGILFWFLAFFSQMVTGMLITSLRNS